uniref:calglandulin-like n=1 Tax=Pristiophorus japonicus TaxID=55135 RepID=UPI00398EEC46
MKFRTWNVRTLMDNPNRDRPEQCTAMVARELRRFDVDIAALSKTRQKEEPIPTDSDGINDQPNVLPPELLAEYKGVFEMFDEEGNGLVKTVELAKLMSLVGINVTKRDLDQMAKDVDKDGKGIFNCDNFLVLMADYNEKSKNQDEELKEAFLVFDPEKKGYIEWNTLKYVLMNAGEPLNEEEAEHMMKEADKDGDGTIDYQEFVDMMTGESFKLLK